MDSFDKFDSSSQGSASESDWETDKEEVVGELEEDSKRLLK